MFSYQAHLKLNLINIIDETTLNVLLYLFKMFHKCNKELYLVGGCVRDILLGRTPKDYDLCTNASPEEAREIALNNMYAVIDTGLKHGTITIYDRATNSSFEVTTYRIDGDYLDNRHPENVVFTKSLKEDLKRRDFTINSFAYDLEKDEILMLDESYLLDLKLGFIRAVGDPNIRFQEDALRMMRAIRFSAQLNFTIEAETWKAIKTNASLINNISKERIRDELTKTICSNHPEKLAYLYYTELSSHILPILNRMMECGQHNKWHYLDVAQHTFEVMKGVTPSPIMRWAAFFHDCGKPDTKFLGKDGWEHFYGHPKVSAEIAEKYLEEYKFDNYSKEWIIKLVAYHDIDVKPTMSEAKCRHNLSRFITKYDDFVPDFIELHKADAFAHKLNNPTQTMEELSFIVTLYEKMLTEKQPTLIKDLKVNGNDLKAEGLVGPEIGECLNWMLEIVIEHPEYNTREKLLEYLQMFKEMSFQSS